MAAAKPRNLTSIPWRRAGAAGAGASPTWPAAELDTRWFRCAGQSVGDSEN
jgi:hypothetical protein